MGWPRSETPPGDWAGRFVASRLAAPFLGTEGPASAGSAHLRRRLRCQRISSHLRRRSVKETLTRVPFRLSSDAGGMLNCQDGELLLVAAALAGFAPSATRLRIDLSRTRASGCNREERQVAAHLQGAARGRIRWSQARKARALRLA